jgi:hypothetical protein
MAMSTEKARYVLACAALERLSDDKVYMPMKTLFAPPTPPETTDKVVADTYRKKHWQRSFIQRLIDANLVLRFDEEGNQVNYGCVRGRGDVLEKMVEESEDPVLSGVSIKHFLFPSDYALSEGVEELLHGATAAEEELEQIAQEKGAEIHADLVEEHGVAAGNAVSLLGTIIKTSDLQGVLRANVALLYTIRQVMDHQQDGLELVVKGLMRVEEQVNGIRNDMKKAPQPAPQRKDFVRDVEVDIVAKKVAKSVTESMATKSASIAHGAAAEVLSAWDSTVVDVVQKQLDEVKKGLRVKEAIDQLRSRSTEASDRMAQLLELMRSWAERGKNIDAGLEMMMEEVMKDERTVGKSDPGVQHSQRKRSNSPPVGRDGK